MTDHPAFPEMPQVAGVKLACAASGVKYSGRDDVLLARFCPGTQVAGVLTQSQTASAPVEWCRQHLPRGQCRALLVNSGNANAFTGAAGARHVEQLCAQVAEQTDCDAAEVLAASTGVIGQLLPIEKIAAMIPQLARAEQSQDWHAAAGAIITTDTFAKGASCETQINGAKVTLNGIAKGSGMIEPNMATMLAFIFTDADIAHDKLQHALHQANAESFNAISVDGDTSTSDTCLLFATGKAGNPRAEDDAALADFCRDLRRVMTNLAVQIVRDGEGASKLIQVEVSGAANHDAARNIAKSIANSPLVKTAIAGEDANWGRIVMAVGKAGEQMRQDALEIRIGGTPITGGGQVLPDYDETPVAAHLKEKEILIQVALGVGDGFARVWTCDLTHGYIEINADYRS